MQSALCGLQNYFAWRIKSSIQGLVKTIADKKTPPSYSLLQIFFPQHLDIHIVIFAFSIIAGRNLCEAREESVCSCRQEVHLSI